MHGDRMKMGRLNKIQDIKISCVHNNFLLELTQLNVDGCNVISGYHLIVMLPWLHENHTWHAYHVIMRKKTYVEAHACHCYFSCYDETLKSKAAVGRPMTPTATFRTIIDLT